MNDKIFFFFYNFAHQNAFTDKLIVFLADTFPYFVIMAGGIFLLFHHDVFKAESPFAVMVQKYKEISLVFISGVAAWILAHACKYFFNMPRPMDGLEEITTLFEKVGNGFPSGHAAFFMAFALSIFWSHKKAGYIFMFLALLIGAARVAAGVHYPLDILGGFVLGALISMVIERVRR